MNGKRIIIGITSLLLTIVINVIDTRGEPYHAWGNYSYFAVILGVSASVLVPYLLITGTSKQFPTTWRSTLKIGLFILLGIIVVVMATLIGLSSGPLVSF